MYWRVFLFNGKKGELMYKIILFYYNLILLLRLIFTDFDAENIQCIKFIRKLWHIPSNCWKTLIRCWHSFKIPSSAMLLPIPKSFRVVRAKRLSSFQDSPFANTIPFSHNYTKTILTLVSQPLCNIWFNVKVCEGGALCTMALICVVKYGENVSLSKFFCIAHQSLFDCLVPGQDHHFIWSKVHSEHRPILLWKLKKESCCYYSKQSHISPAKTSDFLPELTSHSVLYGLLRSSCSRLPISGSGFGPGGSFRASSELKVSERRKQRSSRRAAAPRTVVGL